MQGKELGEMCKLNSGFFVVNYFKHSEDRKHMSILRRAFQNVRQGFVNIFGFTISSLLTPAADTIKMSCLNRHR